MSTYILQFNCNAEANAPQVLECHHSVDDSLKKIYEDIAYKIVEKENPHLKNIVINNLELIKIDSNGNEKKIF